MASQVCGRVIGAVGSIGPSMGDITGMKGSPSCLLKIACAETSRALSKNPLYLAYRFHLGAVEGIYMARHNSFGIIAAAVLFCFGLSNNIAMAEDASLLDQSIQHYQFQDFEAAEKGFRQIIKAEPDNTLANYYLGQSLYQTDKAVDALPYLEKAAQSENSPEDIQETLAGAYTAAGKPGKALPYYSKKYKTSPDNEDVAFQYASSLQASGKETEASVIFRKLIEQKGSYLDASRFQLGTIHSGYSAYVSAVDVFKTVDPGSPYGEAAKAYIDALSPMTKPFNVYLSAEGFYNDNPASDSSTLTGAAGAASGGSQGMTFIGMVSTRALELGDRLQAKLGYLYYGSFYKKDFAKDSNFVGHFVNPSLTYFFNTKNRVELKGDIQFFYFNQQKLGRNYGATVTATHDFEAGHSANLHAAYLNKNHNANYNSDGTITSLEYLDAHNLSAGFGGTVIASPNWEGSLEFDYTLTDARTKSHADVTLNDKANDSRNRDHTVSADLTLPLPGILSRISIMGNGSYSYTDYLNAQSGNAYDDVAVGSNITAITRTWGAKAQIQLWKKISLNAIGGFEKSISRSHTSSLTSENNRFYGQLTAYY